jgi:hypothetical protein
MPGAVRWTIKVSLETDLSLRTYLGARGMRKGDLSKFVEDAVRWRMLDSRVDELRDRFQEAPGSRVDLELDEALREVRRKGPRSRSRR